MCPINILTRPNNNNNNRNNNNRNNNNRRPNNGKRPFSFKTRGLLSNEEKERRRKEYLCAYCGAADHSLDKYPLINKNKSSSTSSSHMTNPEPKLIPRPRISDQPDVKLPIFEFSLNVSNISTKTKILLDSGSQLNLMDVQFAKENNIIPMKVIFRTFQESAVYNQSSVKPLLFPWNTKVTFARQNSML